MLKNLSDNLNMLMAKARINSSELARLTGLPATTIKRIRTNDQSNPTVLTLLPIAKYFSLTISELLGCELPNLNSNNLARNTTGALNVPLLSWHECQNFESLDYTKIQNQIFTEKSVAAKCFALRVEKRGLNFFPVNCILIVDPKSEPESGDYVIVAKSGHGASSIKKYIIEIDQKYLQSLIDGVGITLLTSEYKIIGVVIQYKVELKS